MSTMKTAARVLTIRSKSLPERTTAPEPAMITMTDAASFPTSISQNAVRSTRVTPVSGAVIEMVGQPAGTAREIDSSASEPASAPFGPRGRSAESSASEPRSSEAR